MRKAIKQIAALAFLLILFCVGCRFLLFRNYTVHIRVRNNAAPPGAGEEFRPSVENESPETARLGRESLRGNYLSVPVHPEREGDTWLRVVDEKGEEIAHHYLRFSRFGGVYDPQTGGFTGDTAVLIAVSVFWFLVSAIMIWHYFQAKGPAYYAYSTIYYAGFSLFSMVSGVIMTIITVAHLRNPEEFVMYSAYQAIDGASMQFMMLTMPAMVLFALAMAVSNVELLRHERPHLSNLFGLLISALLLVGEAVGLYLFMRDFSGPEWEGRIRNTLDNVYATVFVYFQCMLTGSAVCGLKAARHQPAYGQDVIIILGCWFRGDGTLPPLLKGRADRAIAFWKAQKEATGREAIFIPSGGQGRDEPMPEAEALRRYLIGQRIPDTLIYPETRSQNTYQNMAFSKEIAEGVRPEGRTVFATTNYHVFRSGLWAYLAGNPAEGIGQKTRWWFWPNAFMRECAGLLQKRWKQEILFLLVLVAFFGVLSMAVG